MSDIPLISVDRIGKAHRIWEDPSARLGTLLLESAAGLLPGGAAPRRWLEHQARARYRDFWALRDISFTLRRGESLGIVGRNGSGKSTLLQIIAGTLRPSTGAVSVNGRVAALLELGSGFNPDFTGRENVYLNAAVLGLTRCEIDERFDRIAAFADIGDFIDQPVKTYSSGMFVRLAFAVQTTVEPQILIIDEALSVGDVFFQQRCYERMRQLLDRGVCIILVTHDLAAVQHFCQTCLVLQSGRAAFYGPATEGTKFYLHLEQEEKAAAYAAGAGSATAPAAAEGSIPHWPGQAPNHAGAAARVLGNGWARCTFAAVCNEAGEPNLHFRQGQTLSVFYEFEILRDLGFCTGCVTIRDKTNQAVHSKITLQDGVREPAQLARGSRLRIRQDTVLNIACADYTLDLSLEMLTGDLLSRPGITYEDLMAAQLRVCELHAVASFTVRLREETHPFQLLHFGTAGLPSRAQVAALPPPAP